jgi:hypothetical protein
VDQVVPQHPIRPWRSVSWPKPTGIRPKPKVRDPCRGPRSRCKSGLREHLQVPLKIVVSPVRVRDSPCAEGAAVRRLFFAAGAPHSSAYAPSQCSMAYSWPIGAVSWPSKSTIHRSIEVGARRRSARSEAAPRSDSNEPHSSPGRGRRCSTRPKPSEAPGVAARNYDRLRLTEQ